MGRISDFLKKMFSQQEKHIEANEVPLSKRVRVTPDLIPVFNEMLSKNKIINYSVVEHPSASIETADFVFKSETDAGRANMLKMEAILVKNQSKDKTIDTPSEELIHESQSSMQRYKNRYMPFERKGNKPSLDSVIAQCSNIAAEQKNRYKPLQHQKNNALQI